MDTMNLVSMYTITLTCQNNTLIFKLRGWFPMAKLMSFVSYRVRENGNFYAKSVFDKMDILLDMVVTQKLITILVFSIHSFKIQQKLSILDSERSDESIDFTILCVFFFYVSVYTRTCRNNASISIWGWFPIRKPLKSLVPYDSDFYEICRKREKLQSLYNIVIFVYAMYMYSTLGNMGIGLTYTPHNAHVGGSSLAIKKLCEIWEWPILSFVMMTSNCLGVLMGNVQLSVFACMSLYKMIFVEDDSVEEIVVLAAWSARSFIYF
ncbi:Uncharacterized protein FWK35_00023792 [Aphis craccivora]|uniref:Uncharacterized protein n=1 Tax=Aphis craccivora TaxID=307492 RepID=A0A6G0W1M9_APHCR|nr:Uncharacterized protein FWK35_00023792 [Aphis craccivora]